MTIPSGNNLIRHWTKGSINMEIAIKVPVKIIARIPLLITLDFRSNSNLNWL